MSNKVHKRFHQCPNCSSFLDRNDKYCPQCGQENHDTNVSFQLLFSELISTYLALDSSFIKTIKPFLFKPGFLTNAFNAGKRRAYANPVRMYLIASLFYFFILNYTGIRYLENKNTDDTDISTEVISDSLSNEQLKDSLDIQIDEIIRKSTTGLTLKKINKNDISNGEISSKDSQLDDTDTLIANKDTSKVKSDDLSKKFILSKIDYKLVQSLKYDQAYSDQMLLDSMHLGHLKWWEEYLSIQTIRIVRANAEAFTSYILQNLPLMMMLAIPIFALILKLFYIRRKHLYVQHFIHALHLHAFAYFLYGISLVIMYFLIKSDSWNLFIWIATFCTMGLYAYKSFRNVYKQRRRKTIIKFLGVGYTYSFLVFIFFLVEALASMLLF